MTLRSPHRHWPRGRPLCLGSWRSGARRRTDALISSIASDAKVVRIPDPPESKRCWVDDNWLPAGQLLHELDHVLSPAGAIAGLFIP